MAIYVPAALLYVFSILHSMFGSDVVSGICTVAIIFLFVLDEMKESIISSIKEKENNNEFR